MNSGAVPWGTAKNRILLSTVTLSIMAAVSHLDLLLRRSLLGMAQRQRKAAWSPESVRFSVTSYVRLLALVSSIQSFSSGSSIEFSTDPIASITTRRPMLSLASYTSTRASAVIALRAALEVRRALSIFNFLLPLSWRWFIPACDRPGPKGARAAKTSTDACDVSTYAYTWC